MRKLLNTLYITRPDVYVAREGENLVLRAEGEELARRPIHILEGVVMLGYVGMSPGAMRLCCERGVGVSFLTPEGRFCARVEGAVRGNVLLRRRQYRLADDRAEALPVARNMILAKISNGRKVMLRALRDYDATPGLEKAARRLARSLEEARAAVDHDGLRGVEGEAARSYFAAFDDLIRRDKAHFNFVDRNRRPPRDPVNALLSFAYSLIAHEVESALEAVGLDPCVGFFHRDRPGRPSLALDMMEELRPYLGDRFVLTLINRGQVRFEDFEMKPSGSVLLKEEARRDFLAAWQKRKQDEVEHPYLHERMEVGLIPFVQAMLMARFLRGDLEAYPPFLMT